MAILAGLLILTACADAGSRDPLAPPAPAAGTSGSDLLIQVFEPGGAPAAGATVTVQLRAGLGPTTELTADGQGRARYGPLRAHERIQVAARLEGFGGTTMEARRSPGETLDVSLVLGGEFDLLTDFDGLGDGLVKIGMRVRNTYDRALFDVVVHDSVDPGGFARSIRPEDVVVDRSRFPDASVTVHSDGFSFTVRLGELPPTSQAEHGYVPAYDLTLPAAEGNCMWLHAAVGGALHPVGVDLANRDDTGMADLDCFTLGLDVENEDGQLTAAGSFDPAPEAFRVGESVVYRVVLTNPGFALTDVRVVDELAPNEGNLAIREIVGEPSRGTATFDDRSLEWTVGDLPSGESAELLFRAEALAVGDDVNRVRIGATQLTGEKIDEEPTRVEQ